VQLGPPALSIPTSTGDPSGRWATHAPPLSPKQPVTVKSGGSTAQSCNAAEYSGKNDAVCRLQYSGAWSCMDPACRRVGTEVASALVTPQPPRDTGVGACARALSAAVAIGSGGAVTGLERMRMPASPSSRLGSNAGLTSARETSEKFGTLAWEMSSMPV